VVDDAINAGSAVRATVADLVSSGARVGAAGTLLVLGDVADDWASEPLRFRLSGPFAPHGRDPEEMMRAVILLPLMCPALVGCFRTQGVEGEITKALPAGNRPPTAGSGDASQHPARTSASDATPEELVDALKRTGVSVDLRPAPGYDRNGAVASLLILRESSASKPPSVLAYLCADEGVARELVGLMGGDAFSSGRFAIGPSSQTPDDQALARKIRKALD